MELSFEKFVLSNGLRVVFHEDQSTPMVAVNVLYDVGARDENPEQTGFAHLFEHLMFGGSVNIPVYDEPLQMAGGENNAFTTNDITNYYIQIPSQNAETAFWLESDRMLSLAFNEKSLDVQRKVVTEEFKEHYINKPYGDAWKHLRSLTYQVHPYQWMTIGKELSHIQDAKLEDVKAFFKKHYNPANAILSVAGNISLIKVKDLAEKWFGSIPVVPKHQRELPVEPVQETPRELTIHANVPLNAIYKAWHIPGRMTRGYYDADIITEIMGNGNASRLFLSLVKEQRLMSNVNCYHTGSLDPGLFVIEGKIMEGISVEVVNAAIEKEMSQLIELGVTAAELEKAKNKVESMIEFEDMNLLSRATNLAYYELLGDAALINKELDNYREVTVNTVQEFAASALNKNRCSSLFYLKDN